MSVLLEAGTIHLRGASVVEDAEILLGLLQADPQRPVDLRETAGLHAAVLQILLTIRPPITGPADDNFVNRWLLPILAKRSSFEAN